jgi:hypothetical protein
MTIKEKNIGFIRLKTFLNKYTRSYAFVEGQHYVIMLFMKMILFVKFTVRSILVGIECSANNLLVIKNKSNDHSYLTSFKLQV